MKVLKYKLKYKIDVSCYILGLGPRAAFWGFIGLAVLVMLYGCGSENQDDKISIEKSVQAETVRVDKGRLPDLHYFPGRVMSKVSITLAAKMPGYVRDIPHEIGDFVTKDGLLVGLDDTDIKAGIAALEQSFRAASRQRQALGARLRYVETTWNRVRKLHDEGSATQDEFDRITSEKAALAGQVAALDAQVRQVKARLNEARNQLQYVIIRAPSDGRLTRKMVDRGAFVMPGMPLVQFESSGEGAWFAADVDESLISKVKTGMPVTIYLPSVRRMIDAGVTQAAPDSSPASHTFSILCDISSFGLPSGLYGRVYIPAGHRQKLLAPCRALVDRGGIVGVYVVDSERQVHWRVIKTGNKWVKNSSGYGPAPWDCTVSAADCFIEVLTGLVPGEELVVSNLDRVREGFRLE